MDNDAINHPAHYTSHPSGVECIQVTEHFGFNLGNAIKYIWRADLKGAALDDLKKARWYIEREIVRRQPAVITRECKVSTKPLVRIKSILGDDDHAEIIAEREGQ